MSRIARCLAVAGFLLASAWARADAPFSFDATPGALPKDVVPIEYVVHLVPDAASHRFRGEQRVLLEVRRTTREIRLHALELEVTSASLAGNGLPRTVLGAPRVDADRQMLVFTPPRALRPGRYRLSMTWRGVINTTAEAFFLDPYRSPAGERALLATDFEPTGARRLLPCWDEPAFRARFRFSVDLPAASAAVSNMPAAKRVPIGDGLVRTTFSATPAMPSYLIALVAGELERTEGVVDGTRIGIVTTEGKRASAAFALAAAQELLHDFNGYFGTPYPLPKLDHIALPGGFSGAMENWGAIIYNEAALLVAPGGSEQSERRVYGIVAHETAHQWFGNLVTMAWWDDLWLNEAFATWMATRAGDRAHPQWRVWLDAALRRDEAMALDARPTAHPIHQPIRKESEAESAFDDITYEKGAGFLRMLEDHLGEAAFRDGIRAYLLRHRGSNTTAADLWAALGAASGRPVAGIASAWIEEPGFPLLSIDARCEAGQRIVGLRQSAFRAEPASADASAPAAASATPSAAPAALWRVPVRIGTASGAGGESVLLENTSMEVASRAGCDDPLLIDPGNVGYFRVRYAPPLFEALLARWPTLPDSARLKLGADSAALLQSGQQPLASHLALMARMPNEPRLAIWSRVLTDLALFDSIADEASRPVLKRYAISLLEPRFAALGWDERPGESGEDRLLRPRLAMALAEADDAATLDEGRARFTRSLAEPESVPASMTVAVAQIAARGADAATWEQLRARAERALATEDKFRDYRALAAARDPALAERTMALATSREVPQLVRHSLLAAVAQAGHREAAWAYSQAHADALLADAKRYDNGKTFASIAQGAASAAMADRLLAFAQAKLPADALPEIRRAEDEIRIRARLQARLLPDLKAALGVPPQQGGR